MFVCVCGPGWSVAGSRNRHIELYRISFWNTSRVWSDVRGPKTGPFRSRRENELDLVNFELSCSDVRRSRMDISGSLLHNSP